MATINTDAIGRVTQALASFRAIHNSRAAFVGSYESASEGMTDHAFDLAAEGMALARAVAALLGEPELQSLIPE